MKSFLDNYSISEFLYAISDNGKFIKILAPFIDLELAIIEKSAKSLVPMIKASIGMMPLDSNHISTVFNKFRDRFRQKEHPETFEPMMNEIIANCITDRDKAELWAANRIAFLLLEVIKILNPDRGEDANSVVNFIWGMVYEIECVHGLAPKEDVNLNTNESTSTIQ